MTPQPVTPQPATPRSMTWRPPAPARTVLVVAPESAEAVSVLGPGSRDAVVVLPDPATWPRDRHFDLVVLVGLGPDEVAEQVLSACDAMLSDGGRLALALGEDSPVDPAAWERALHGRGFVGAEALGDRVLALVTGDGGVPAGAAVAGAALALREQARVRTVVPPREAPPVPHRPAGAPRRQVRRLRARHARLRAKYRQLKRSRVVRWSTRYQRWRDAGLRRLPGSRVRRGLAVVVLAALLTAAVVLAGVAVAVETGSALGGAGAATAAALLVLIAGGQLLLHRRVSRLRTVTRKARRAERRRDRRTGRLLRQVRDLARAADARDRETAATLERNTAGISSTATVVGELGNALLGAGLQSAGARTRAEYAQQQSLAWLYSQFRVSAPVPTMRGWAASPDVLEVLLGELGRRRPRVVLECGSGVSTLWLALAVDQRGLATRIVSLEHNAEFAQRTRDLLEQHGLAHLADVRVAPLVDVGLAGHEAPWYDPAAVADLSDIGLVFIDGPPESTGDDARLPAVPILYPRLADSVSIVLDDAKRPDERTAVASWLERFPDLTDERIDTEKGTVVLRRGPVPRTR